MTGQCPDCGARLGAADSVCRACGLPVPGAAPRAPRPRRVASPERIELGGTPPPRGRASDAGPPGGSLAGGSSLGDMPEPLDSDAFDLSAILDAAPAEKTAVSPGPTRPAFVPAFTFPGSNEEPVDLSSLDSVEPEPSSPGGGTGPTRVDRPSGAVAPGESWRVRNANQTVYDLGTVDAVVQWLSNKESFDGIRIARGDGPFRPLEDYPELAARLGLKSATGFSSAPPPQLDLDAAPRRPASSRASAPPGARPPMRNSAGPAAAGPAVQGGAPGRAGARESAAKAAPATGGLGLGFTLAIGAVGAGLTLALTLVAQGAGMADLAPAPAAGPTSEAEAAPGPLLAAALQAIEADRMTAAEQILQQARRSDAEKADPRVHRQLAIALSKLGGRDAEARAALAEYRRLRARASGD